MRRRPAPSHGCARCASPGSRRGRSLTRCPHCDDEIKCGLMDMLVQRFEDMTEAGGQVAGRPIKELITVNGVRLVAEDGTWGSRAPPPTSPNWWSSLETRRPSKNMRDMSHAVDAVLRESPEVRTTTRRSEHQRRTWLATEQRHPGSEPIPLLGHAVAARGRAALNVDGRWPCPAGRPGSDAGAAGGGRGRRWAGPDRTGT